MLLLLWNNALVILVKYFFMNKVDNILHQQRTKNIINGPSELKSKCTGVVSKKKKER